MRPYGGGDAVARVRASVRCGAATQKVSAKVRAVACGYMAAAKGLSMWCSFLLGFILFVRFVFVIFARISLFVLNSIRVKRF